LGEEGTGDSRRNPKRDTFGKQVIDQSGQKGRFIALIRPRSGWTAPINKKEKREICRRNKTGERVRGPVKGKRERVNRKKITLNQKQEGGKERG